MKIAICGYYGVRNFGDEVILEVLKRLVLEAYPNSEIVVMGKPGMSKTLGLLPLGVRSLFMAFLRPSLFLKPYRAIKSCDLFILGGGGLFTDEEGSFVSAFWALHGLIAHMLGKPVAIIGVSVAKLNFWNKWLVKRVFKVAKMSNVRDRVSQYLLSRLGIQTKVMTDLAVLLKIPKNEINQQTKYVAISLRRYKNMPLNLYTNLAHFCNCVAGELGLDIRLISLHDGVGNDERILNKIFELVEVKEKVSVHKFVSIDDTVKLLANAEVVVAMRLHAGIISALCETPYIPIGYMRKVKDFWAEFEDIKPIDIRSDNDVLVRSFNEIWNNYRLYKKSVIDIRQNMVISANLAEQQIVTEFRSIVKW